MTRRRLLCGLLLLSAVLACFGGWTWMASGPRMTRARFEQVQVGMSREKVIRTVGGPPGTYSERESLYTHFDFVFTCDACWVGDDARLLVFFDEAGTVTNTLIVDHFVPPQTLTERIRRWLGL
jgi:hypothetical protein